MGMEKEYGWKKWMKWAYEMDKEKNEDVILRMNGWQWRFNMVCETKKYIV
jgi:hypothetical protein